MTKYLIVIAILALVIVLETGYIALVETGTLPTSSNRKVSNLSFNPPQSGKEVYDDLSSLSCRIYPATDTTFTTSDTMQYVPSYNAFFDLAKGESVILYQYLTTEFVPYDNVTAGAEGVLVFLLKENCFWISFTWQFGKSGNATQQLANERELQGFLAPNLDSQLSGYLGNLGGTTSKVGSAIQIQSIALSGTNVVVYVQNVGDSSINFVNGQCLYINGALNAGTAVPTTLAQGATATITSVGGTLQSGQTVTIKVTSEGGTYSQITQTLP